MGTHDQKRKTGSVMNTTIIMTLMVAIIFYTYVGYGLVIWIMLKMRKFKKLIWSTHK